MATRKIRIDGDSILRKICKPVTEMTPRLSQLIDDMFDTMYEAKWCRACSATGWNCKEDRCN